MPPSSIEPPMTNRQQQSPTGQKGQQTAQLSEATLATADSQHNDPEQRHGVDLAVTLYGSGLAGQTPQQRRREQPRQGCTQG